MPHAVVARRQKLEKRMSTIANSIKNIERYVEFMVRNTTAKHVTRYRGVDYMDRDEIADLSRSTPNARFLRLILDALFYQDPQTRERSSKRDKERMIYAKDVFFTLRHDSEDEARKAWT